MSVENRYVTDFIPSNREGIITLAELNEEITLERQFWINSGAAEKLAVLYIEALGGKIDDLSPVAYKQLLTFKRSEIFGEVEIKSDSLHKSKKTFGQMPAKTIRATMHLANMADEHKSNYKRAIAPLAEQKMAVEGGLSNHWIEFMGSLKHVEDFAVFLQEEQFNLAREGQRPFLQVLARRFASGGNNPNSLSNLLSQKVLERCIENLDEHLFGKFVDNLLTLRTNKGLETTLQWVRLVSHQSQIDRNTIYALIRETQIFPNDLKDLYTGFIRNNLMDQLLVIVRVLGNYKPRIVQLPSTVIGVKSSMDIFSRKGAGLAKQTNNPLMVVSEGNELVGDRPVYKLTLEGVTDLSEQALESYINKTADGLSLNDPRMNADVTSMIKAVTDDPFGFGVAKLNDRMTTSSDGTKRLPIRRFRADKRPGMDLEHPNSKALRVVYHIEKRGEGNLVVLHDILNHGEYDRKYG